MTDTESPVTESLNEWRLERAIQRETLKALRASARFGGVELHRTGFDRYRSRTPLEKEVIRYVAARMQKTLADVLDTLDMR